MKKSLYISATNGITNSGAYFYATYGSWSATNNPGTITNTTSLFAVDKIMT